MDIFGKYYCKSKDLVKKGNAARDIYKILKFMTLTEALEKKPEITKLNRSPNRIIKKQRKV